MDRYEGGGGAGRAERAAQSSSVHICAVMFCKCHIYRRRTRPMLMGLCRLSPHFSALVSLEFLGASQWGGAQPPVEVCLRGLYPGLFITVRIYTR